MKSAESLSSSKAFTMSSLGTSCWITISALSGLTWIALDTDVKAIAGLHASPRCLISLL